MWIYLESKPTIYRNPELERKINDNKNEPSFSLSWESLTDDDMEIVAYYLLRNNTVSKCLYLFFLGKKIGEFQKDSILIVR